MKKTLILTPIVLFCSTIHVVVSLSVKSRAGSLLRRMIRAKPSTTVEPDAANKVAPSSSSSLSPLSYANVFGQGNQKQQPYVPQGLTAAEYAALRRKEAAAEAARDYGAWGPRFVSSTQKPPDNWFLSPQLWTTGVPPENVSSNYNKNNDMSKSTVVVMTLRRYLVALWMAAVIVQVLWTAVQLVIATLNNNPATTTTTTTTIPRLFQHVVKIFLMQGHPLLSSSSSSGLLLMMAKNVGVVVTLAVPLQRTLRNKNNRRLAKTSLVVTAVSLLSLAAFTIIISVLGRILIGMG